MNTVYCCSGHGIVHKHVGKGIIININLDIGIIIQSISIDHIFDVRMIKFHTAQYIIVYGIVADYIILPHINIYAAVLIRTKTGIEIHFV